MRIPRIKAHEGQPGVYHCMSRVVGAQHLLDDAGKELLVILLHKLAAFCEVEVITYCMMSNHFHLLIRVPPPRPSAAISDSELLVKIVDFYGPNAKPTELAQASVGTGLPIPESIRDSIVRRLGNISAFLQEFKQRFSRWYNTLHQRSGYFWSERFKSVLVEDGPEALRAVAAYIELNPVRAGMVDDPKDYRFCGYAAALAGNPSLRRGLMRFLEAKSWNKAAAEYRLLLYVTGGRAGSSDKAALSREEILAELARGGTLPLGQILRLRIRHMTDGVAAGSTQFVDAVWKENRTHFGAQRTSGARPIQGAPIPGITVLRNLRKNSIC